jgi:AcrR family transcriptional regulator
MADYSTRQHLIETALRLSRQNRTQSLSVNTILAEAGVARQTLYRHFSSKDDLMLAVQRRDYEQFRVWFQAAVDARARRPQDRLLAMFDVLDDWLSSKKVYARGLGSSSFDAESVNTGTLSGEALENAAEHERLQLVYISRTASQARAQNPDRLARDLLLLTEGAIRLGRVGGDLHSAKRAKRIAAHLIDDAFAAAIPA